MLANVTKNHLFTIFLHLEFQSWKMKEQSLSQYSWVKRYPESTTLSGKLYVYYCNRSGKQRVIKDHNRKRAMRTQGSCKLNDMCTSSIVLKENSGHFKATYYKTHYGHGVSISHIPLAKDVKQTIAAQLELGLY